MGVSDPRADGGCCIRPPLPWAAVGQDLPVRPWHLWATHRLAVPSGPWGVAPRRAPWGKLCATAKWARENCALSGDWRGCREVFDGACAYGRAVARLHADPGECLAVPFSWNHSSLAGAVSRIRITTSPI
jgi:hypothetical protein